MKQSNPKEVNFSIKAAGLLDECYHRHLAVGSGTLQLPMAKISERRDLTSGQEGHQSYKSFPGAMVKNTKSISVLDSTRITSYMGLSNAISSPF